MDIPVVSVGFGVAGIGFLALFVFAASNKTRFRQRWLLLTAIAANAVWALTIAGAGFVQLPGWLALPVEIVRIAGWLVFTAALLPVRQSSTGLQALKVAAFALPAVLAVMAGARFTMSDPSTGGWLLSGGTLWMLMPVVGLLLIENIYRNADQDARWAIKHLCLGIGIIYAYDFFYFAEAVLFGGTDQSLFAARGFVNAMMAPLIGISIQRARSWSVEIRISRHIVFRSLVLFGTGIYLLAMVGVDFYIRTIDSEWSVAFQVVFLVGAAAILILIFASGALRARAKLFISRNFFALKYDYRQTWLHFIQALSAAEPRLGLHRRLLDAVSSLMESTAAGLWLRSADASAFLPATAWNFGANLRSEPVGSAFDRWLTAHGDVIEIAEAADEGRYPDLSIPDWLRTLRRGWLVIPLIHRHTLEGFIVLGEPRSGGVLDWEDFELLQAIGRQAASYVAEENAARALLESRQMELFSKRFAFVAHDLKNIVGQLSLMLRNAERFKNRPEFREDMIETVANSVDRMSALLQQLQTISDVAEAGAGDTSSRYVPLNTLLHQLGTAWKENHPGLRVELRALPDTVEVPAERFRSVVEHLLQNAFDAAGGTGQVALRARHEDGMALIEVEDDGPGMEPDFVDRKLFRPFNSTKSNGFGIGTFQVREYVLSLGGRIDVRTAPQRGTTMQVRMPLHSSRQNYPLTGDREAFGQ